MLFVRRKAHSCLGTSWSLYQPLLQQQPQQGYTWAGLVAKVLFEKLGASTFGDFVPRLLRGIIHALGSHVEPWCEYF